VLAQSQAHANVRISRFSFKKQRFHQALKSHLAEFLWNDTTNECKDRNWSIAKHLSQSFDE
jgi:hypothetical protein